MSDHWNIQLLNQHAAILKSALKTVNTVARSTGEEAEEPADSINQGPDFEGDAQYGES